MAQLTQRTNQFNFTTIRRNDGEILHLSESGLECRVVEVSDRFGDYGLVGVMIFGVRGDSLEVDTFLLSCRVLGRGVEHRMVSELGKIAEQRGVSLVNTTVISTRKNLPARSSSIACSLISSTRLTGAGVIVFPRRRLPPSPILPRQLSLRPK